MNDHDRYRLIDEGAELSSRVFVRRGPSRSVHHVAVMALPVVVAILFAGCAVVLAMGAPGGRERIPTTVVCCTTVSKNRVGVSDDRNAVTMVSQFRIVYEPRKSQIADVQRAIAALGVDPRRAERHRLGALVSELSQHYGYDPALIVAVIQTESSFNPRSRSHKGALGLMQLLPNTAESLAEETNRPWLGEHALLDPTLNISLGVRYLAKLQKRFGSLEVALAAYNYGPSRISQILRSGRPVPMDYTDKVLSHYESIREFQRPSEL